MALLYDPTKSVNPYTSLLAQPLGTSSLIAKPATVPEVPKPAVISPAVAQTPPISTPIIAAPQPKVPATLDSAMAKKTAEPTAPVAPVAPAPVAEKPIGTKSDGTPLYDDGSMEANALLGKYATQAERDAAKEQLAKEYEATQQPGYVKPITPITELSAEQKAAYDIQLNEQVDNYTRQADAKIKEIRAEGGKTQASAKSLLAKYGALGRTLTGAPVETGLGAASAIQSKIEAAVREEEQNRDALIASARTGSAEAVQKKIDALNTLQQQNYDKALELAKGDKDRYMTSGTGIFDKQTGTWAVEPTEKEQETKIIGTEKTGYYEYDPATKETTLLIPANKTADELTVSEKISLAEKGYTLGSDGKLVKTTDTGAISNEAKDWASLISEGKAKITEVPANMRNQVATALNSLPAKQADLASTEKKIEVLEALANNKGIDTTVGAYGINRINFNPFSWSDKAQKNSLIADIDKLVGEKALQALVDAKASGATFGALSDSELQLLKNSSAKFASWARDKDGDGKTDYYEIDEKTFKDEINRIKGEYQDILDRARQGQQGTTTQTLDEYYKSNPNKQSQIEQMINENPNMTDDEIMQVLGFSSVGGDTKTATKAVAVSDGTKYGQCGRFVNKLTGIGLGDSYESKISKMDSNITEPQPGMVFVMPYKNTGHTGIILSVNPDGTATVKDSNYSLDQKVKTHKIPISKMTGFAYA
jgi:hypothetical protein